MEQEPELGQKVVYDWGESPMHTNKKGIMPRECKQKASVIEEMISKFEGETCHDHSPRHA